MELANGTALHGGAYKIIQSLGQGSFGITYLAEHTALGKKVCIKEFFMKELNSRSEDGSITGLSDGSLSYNYAQKFRKEAQNLARMDHPNIVSVTDCFDENGTFYYVMEYIEGQDLNRYLKQHSMTEAEAVSIISDVADALIYMHEEKRMLHLDLKPGNVMRRNSDEHIFLIDFGLSKHFSAEGQPETSTTIGLGTAGYAPIEQSNQAKNGEFRPTIDVYALGATLYKLLTRQTPPPASELVSDEDLLRDEMQKKGVSERLIGVVEKAMTPNVRKRTQTVRDFKNSLNVGVDSKNGENIGSVVFGGNTAVGREENIVTEDESTELLAQVGSSSEKDLEQLRRATESGDADAMCKLGDCYLYGLGVAEDEYEAVEWYRKSVAFGNARAMCKLGECYYYGDGVDEDDSKAVEWYRKSADLGNAEAMIKLGECYIYGRGVAEDCGMANKWFRKVTNSGNAEAIYDLGNMYKNGNTVSKDGTKAVGLFRKSADLGYGYAMVELGRCYKEGIGVPEDEVKAVEWYEKAADLGNDDAMYELGECYLYGFGVAEDNAKAVEWYRKAADLCNSDAMRNLGECYYYGIGVAEDNAKAVEWYEKAADWDDSDAMIKLGECYEEGIGVPEDEVKAVEWYREAADLCNADAMCKLGECYLKGIGVAKNKDLAIYWLEKAVDEGSSLAEAALKKEHRGGFMNFLVGLFD